MTDLLNSGRDTCRLYLISPPALDPLIFAQTLTRALDAGDVATFQLRLPKASEDQITQACDLLMPVCHAREVAFLLNDRADIAKKTGIDGVHLGRQDMGISEARRLLGPNAIIGASAINSRHDAMSAAEAGADYVSFSPFAHSRSPFYPPEVIDAQDLVSPDILSWWQETMETPCVAAGGIRLDTAAALATAGADFIAACTAVWESPQGAAAAVAAFNKALAD